MGLKQNAYTNRLNNVAYFESFKNLSPANEIIEYFPSEDRNDIINYNYENI